MQLRKSQNNGINNVFTKTCGIAIVALALGTSCTRRDVSVEERSPDRFSSTSTTISSDTSTIQSDTSTSASVSGSTTTGSDTSMSGSTSTSDSTTMSGSSTQSGTSADASATGTTSRSYGSAYDQGPSDRSQNVSGTETVNPDTGVTSGTSGTTGSGSDNP